jgi:CRP/FNR family transcriptional regulator, nitrogen fixation regulation protein
MLKQQIAIGSTGAATGGGIVPRTPLRSGLGDAFTVMGARLNIERNAEIYGEGEAAEYVYWVVQGVVRTYKLLSDGRRQINTFHLPGNFFGLDSDEDYRFTAEAVTDATVVFVKRSALVALAGRDGEVANDLWRMAAAELHRAHDHMLLLGRKSAQERIAAFLLEMAERGKASDTIELPMSRLDIADYLGLTIETVSRTLTLLENSAAIELPSTRRVRLCNKAALSRLNA